MSEVVSIKLLIFRMISIVKLCFKFFYVVFIFILIGGVVAFFLESTKSEPYTATLSFTVKEGGNDSFGGIGSVLGQIGINSSESNLDKIVEIGRSKIIIYEVLLKEVDVDGEVKPIGDHIISLYPEYFLGSESVLSVAGDKNLPILKALYNKFLGNLSKGGEGGFVKISYNFTTQILYVNVKLKSERLAMLIIDEIYNTLSNFYIMESVQKSVKSLESLTTKTDSINNVLQKTKISLARYKDRSSNFFLQKDIVTQQELELEIQILSIMYVEIVKNREATKYIIENKMPFFQIIDRPILPLDRYTRLYVRNTIIGSIFGGLVGVFIILMVSFILKEYRKGEPSFN